MFRECRRKRNDGPWLQITVGPAVQAVAHDAGKVGFAARQNMHVFGDRGMAQRARDAETLQDKFPVSSWADLSLRANDGVQTQQRQRRLRIVQREAAVLNALDNVAGSTSASTFRPTDAAVSGSTAVWITLFICSTSVQNVSSPKVS